MLYLEELVDAVISEEGQTLMGLDFLFETLDLPMSKIDLIFKKALSEYSERRPMKVDKVINAFDYSITDEDGNQAGYVKLPEGTTSCRVARYGVLPQQMPRYYMPKFSEQNVEFDPFTLICKVWPPVAPLRLTYTQKYVPTTNVLIQAQHAVPYETSETSFILDTSFAGNTLFLQKAVVTTGEEGEPISEVLTMSPTGDIFEDEEYGEVTRKAELSGTLGHGYVDLKTREVSLEMNTEQVSPIMISYYPKYSCVKELNIGDRIFTKLFASKLLGALASLRSQATQEKLHSMDLSSDELYTRVQELKQEVKEIGRNTISFWGMSPQ